MLRACAAAMALVAVTACSGTDGPPGIEPLDVGDAEVADSAEVPGEGPPGEGPPGDDAPGEGPAGRDQALPAHAVTAEVDIDITTVPDEITGAYVAAVLAELEALYAEAAAAHVAAGEPTLETTTKLGSAFTEIAYARRLRLLIELAQEGFVELAEADRIRPRTHSEVQVLSAGEGCIYAETRLDPSPVRKDPAPVLEVFVQLMHRDREILEDVNPTPWLIHAMAVGESELLRELDPCGH